MNIGAVISWGITDIFAMIVIIIFIKLIYQNRYGTTAYLYLKNQLELFSTHCITCTASLYIYYFLEDKFHIDNQYTGGIILTLFFLVSGVGGNRLYQTHFRKNTDKYNPTKEEYLVITSAAFIAVTSKLVSEGIIEIVIPCALLLGRFIWLDTSSLKDIRDSVMVKHMRVVESAILLIVGMLILSAFMSVFNLLRAIQPFIAVLYGVIILYPVEKIRPYLYRTIKRITRRKDNK